MDIQKGGLIIYLINLIKLAFTKWSGRFSRKEYIIFLLGAFGINVGLVIVLLSMAEIIALLPPSLEYLVEIPFQIVLIGLIVCFVVISVAYFGAIVRRLHDTDRSGWNILISAIPLIGVLLLYWLFFVPSKEIGDTRWG